MLALESPGSGGHPAPPSPGVCSWPSWMLSLALAAAGTQAVRAGGWPCTHVSRLPAITGNPFLAPQRLCFGEDTGTAYSKSAELCRGGTFYWLQQKPRLAPPQPPLLSLLVPARRPAESHTGWWWASVPGLTPGGASG